jgi:hypothetical protein
MPESLIKIVSSYRKGDDSFVGEHELKGIGLDGLQSLFGVPSDNRMDDGYPVGTSEAAVLPGFVADTLNLERYDSFVDCHDAAFELRRFGAR